jgi:CheY-like chemotaxis protein
MSADSNTPSINKRVAKHQARVGMLNVLVVDDQRSSRLLIDQVLKQLGHRTVACANADRGIQQLHKQHFDLVVVDIHMPVVDGPKLAETIRSLPPDNPTPADVPILFVTADATQCAAVTPIVAGTTGCLGKPVLPDPLADEIERLITKQ